MASIRIEDAAFLSGLAQALKETDQDGTRILHEVGDAVVERAKQLAPELKHPDVRYRPGALRASINMQVGRDSRGPWVDVGTDLPYAMFPEYGTFKDRPTPYMRPALSLAAKAIRTVGGRATRRSPRARAFAVRAGKRTLIRKALSSGQISGSEARSLSREVSSKFRFRARRKRS